MPPEKDKMLSHYRLIEEIGQGGMGIVWKAGDVILDRTVAIKILPSDAARDERRRKMFLEEARLASSLSDAHIAQVHELGREGDLDFIVLELVEGKPLSRILHGRPLPPDKVASLGLQVAQALARAHRKCLLHRATRRLVDAFPNEPNAHALRTWALCAEGWLLGRVLPPSSPKWKEMEDTCSP